MNMELRSNGASFVAAKTDHNPRDLVVTVIEKAPDSTRKEQFDEFRRMLCGGSEEYQRAVDWYFFVNMHDYLTTNRNRTVPAAERAQRQEQKAAMIENVKQRILLLNHPMTNGKLLGDCTGAELATMGNRFQKLAERVGKAKTVRSVLSEDEVKKILA